MDKCKHCGNELKHIEGRKKKDFCNVNCRNKYFYAKNKRLIEEAKKIVPKAPVPVAPTQNEVLEQIKAVKAEKIPSLRDTILGRKSWATEQQKRISDLQDKLK